MIPSAVTFGQQHFTSIQKNEFLFIYPLHFAFH